MPMGKFCPRYVRSFELNHYSYISLPCNTSFSSFHGVLLIRTLVRHVLKIETNNTQVKTHWLKSELRCPGKFLCSISGSSASGSSHLVFTVENRLYNSHYSACKLKISVLMKSYKLNNKILLLLLLSHLSRVLLCATP